MPFPIPNILGKFIRATNTNIPYFFFPFLIWNDVCNVLLASDPLVCVCLIATDRQSSFHLYLDSCGPPKQNASTSLHTSHCHWQKKGKVWKSHNERLMQEHHQCFTARSNYFQVKNETNSCLVKIIIYKLYHLYWKVFVRYVGMRGSKYAWCSK